MTHTHQGHRPTPRTDDNLAIDEKSGYDSPATIPYTVDRDTPASLATATTVRPSDAKAASSARATTWAARASTGAPEVSLPVVKAPEDSQERGGGALRLVTPPTLPHRGLSDAADTPKLANVRIIGHNAGVESMPRVPETSSQWAASAAALADLALVDVPASGAVGFASEVPDPTKGQRRQSYLALEVLREVLRYDNPKAELSAAIAAHPRADRRSDRARVQAAVLDVLVRLPQGTQLATKDLVEARDRLTPSEQVLLEPQSYPSVLVRLPDGARCFVEVHPARKRGGERDAWMNRRIAKHLILEPDIDAFAGVLVFCVRTLSVVHVLSTSVRHAAGGCAVCQQVMA